ncbi:MAG: chorismate mutase [Spirochaetia bacterium]|jgi:chorismate mutase|nr:chorismate mutase [Spirochaetia bacterium]
MPVRGIRGATSVESNTKEEIFAKTGELLSQLIQKNSIDAEEIASIIFSVTDDIDEAFPAAAARLAGFDFIPLFGCREIPVKGSVSGLIRVLIHMNTEKSQREMQHVYLHRAVQLRPDIASR